MSDVVSFDDSILDRMVLAVELVHKRRRRSTTALEQAGIRYAIAGGHAVAAWVSTIDEGAVRNTPDVDILIERSSFDDAKAALQLAGFHYRSVDGVAMFLDEPNSRERSAVHIAFANENIRDNHQLPAPSLQDSMDGSELSILTPSSA
ncbi:MAG: hypothetical protein AAGD11_11520 [Planctomycetota bacterium]